MLQGQAWSQETSQRSRQVHEKKTGQVLSQEGWALAMHPFALVGLISCKITAFFHRKLIKSHAIISR